MPQHARFPVTLAALLALFSVGCTTLSQPSPTRPPESSPCACAEIPQPVAPPRLEAADWKDLPGWQADRLTEAWSAFLTSCTGLRGKAKWQEWQGVCDAASHMAAGDENNINENGIRAFFERNFRPYAVVEGNGAREGLMTGYYEPLISGSLVRDARNTVPVLPPPADLFTIELGSLHADLQHRRLRGRLVDGKVLPYFSRAEINQKIAAGQWPETPLLWVADPVEFFFLQIQGSGRVKLPDGRQIRIGYADQNGHPYRSIGRLLAERGELALSATSMQGIQAWGRAHPEKLSALLDENPSYVFFRLLPDDRAPKTGPIGALGVPLTPERSIAVDPRAIPLGAPVWLSSPAGLALERLVLAQDTGGAIRGGVRADFFWGFGNAAGEKAGRMKQSGRLWVLLPLTYPIP
ncbi:MAG: MltA domain-containing protein [Zoogloeaceae bacterium]|jgi:membrane-bound lytic murein transglycosylase A|nr:MltA domain-containing protein [Zoogloeaceae bacterium]